MFVSDASVLEGCFRCLTYLQRWSPRTFVVFWEVVERFRLTKSDLDLFIHVYIYIYICMYVCMYVCMHIYICIYIYPTAWSVQDANSLAIRLKIYGTVTKRSWSLCSGIMMCWLLHCGPHLDLAYHHPLKDRCYGQLEEYMGIHDAEHPTHRNLSLWIGDETIVIFWVVEKCAISIAHPVGVSRKGMRCI